MTKAADIKAFRDVISEFDGLAKTMRTLRKKIVDDLPGDHVRAIDVEIPEWFEEEPIGPLEDFAGDAGSASGKFFRVKYKTTPGGVHPNGRAYGPETVVVIFCPTFLRGALTIRIQDGYIGGSY